MNSQIKKRAGVLRKRLSQGSININELSDFLAKVEKTSPPRNSAHKEGNNRLLQQLENLNRGRAKKPVLFTSGLKYDHE